MKNVLGHKIRKGDISQAENKEVQNAQRREAQIDFGTILRGLTNKQEQVLKMMLIYGMGPSMIGKNFSIGKSSVVKIQKRAFSEIGKMWSQHNLCHDTDVGDPWKIPKK